MDKDKIMLLQEQVSKIEEVIATLSDNFSQKAEEEINFLNIVCNNLKEIIE